MTLKKGEVIWSLHFRKKCYFVKNINCLVPTNTKINKTQPKGVVQGFCTDIKLEKDVAIIF